MKDIINRILIGFVVLVIVLIVITLFVRCHDPKKEYTYITNENEWGTSNECYVENKDLICKSGEELVKVRQFYYEE